ncbi:MAG: hypothetical protein C4534_05415 [Gaiellales bacterium]|nr:MAG: hypothetical protein C4534_05415 [Gaiellales bacterium]
MNELTDQGDRRRYIGWMYGGILLGLLNTFAVATYGALGVSRNYVVTDNMALEAAGSDLPQTNSYLSLYPGAVDWLYGIAIGMVLGGFLAALIYRGFNTRTVPRLWAERFGDSRPKRFAAAFAGGFLLLLGARIAGGCTSGLVLSGVAQLSLAGLVFGISIFASGVFTAKLMYRRLS